MCTLYSTRVTSTECGTYSAPARRPSEAGTPRPSRQRPPRSAQPGGTRARHAAHKQSY